MVPLVKFNDRLRQILLIGLILFLSIVFVMQLYIFLPGILGGLTVYILTRDLYLRVIKKWKPVYTAILFISGTMIILAIPVYFTVIMVTPKINSLLDSHEEVLVGLKIINRKITDYTGITLVTAENTKAISTKISTYIPVVLNSTATVLVNVLMLFFLYYYLLVHGGAIEKLLHKLIPLKPANIDKLATETVHMVIANALGIPIICLVQGAFAAVGYLLFGIKDWGMWGFVTGVFAFFPLLGTMVIWVPLVIYLYSINQNYTATGLALYSLIITGNVDYITRLSLLKKMSNVHPVVTVLGLIVGLKLFGFMGLIFGPLLISYFIILIKIYINEFIGESENIPCIKSIY